ncbi:MAG TPA: PEP-CTERM sorting domain-containing protein [Vicinamibacterales bacterium]|nr:PEP-CTERM sorting domain-containing protein [Vicinamibacterales bacterium]
MRSLLCGLIVVFFGIAPAVAHADTIRITSGFVDFDNDPLTFALSGSGFDMHWDTFAATPDIGSAYQCYPCASGSTLSMSAEFSGNQLGDIAAPDEPAVYLGGDLSFASDSITIPADLDQLGAREFSVRRPFTMTGTLLGFSDPSRTGAPLFSHDLTGAGHASIIFAPGDEPNSWRTDIWAFGFEDAATTPEPASLVLLGTGLAFCLIRRRRFARQ